jgi:outer membrane lipoprotein carrier protein
VGAILFLLTGLATSGPPPSDLSTLLKAVEQRYNHANSLEARFEQYYAMQGQRRHATGRLFLLKPGRMRWNYDAPQGKFVVADGRFLYLYSPLEHRLEKTRVKESDDLRTPLAFLLGKLSFRREFQDLALDRDGDLWKLDATPQPGRMPVSHVVFWLNEDGRISRLSVDQLDGSHMDFAFFDEKLNQAVLASYFRPDVPPGTQLIETEGLSEP